MHNSGFYTTWLWLAAPVGLGVFIYGAVMASKYVWFIYPPTVLSLFRLLMISTTSQRFPPAPVKLNTADVTASVGNAISGVFDNAATAPFAFFMSVWSKFEWELRWCPWNFH